MDLGDLRVLTRTYLDENASVVDKFWTDSEVTTAINTGVKRTHNKIKNTGRWHFTSRATFSTAVGVEYYALPANLKDLKIVSFEDSVGVEHWLRRDAGPNMFAWNVAGVGLLSTNTNDVAPFSYWVVGSTIRILPVPQLIRTIRLYYEARIVDLVSESDAPSFDEDYHDMAAKWAAMELMVKNQDDPRGVAALLAAREEDLTRDMLRRLPEPYTATTAFLQGFR